MSVIDAIVAKAKANKKHILLPEGNEERTIKAAEIITKEGVANVTLFGNIDEINAKAKKLSVNLNGIGLIDPNKDSKLKNYVEKFYELRKAKGITPEKADIQMRDPLFFACMMLKEGLGDGMVAGAINTTGNTLRPGLQIVKQAKGISTVSSCFIMEVPNKAYGQDGVLVFADCAVNPMPTSEQLADIAISSASTARHLCAIDPKVAMLSFSTKGSASHEVVDKVRNATELIHSLAPDLSCDGELQADAALVSSVGALKCPNSTVAGHANILVFPDLQAGNIGYKLVQRLAGATALGPICQGFAKPINDLSRGCSIEDIVSVVAITAVQSM
ncbi:MAG: phosphate acetyltransferase [Clostridia bacterium]